VDGHQVVGFPSRVGKSFFEEIIKRLHPLQAPILPKAKTARLRLSSRGISPVNPQVRQASQTAPAHR
jgi:hypothetical protein